MHSLGKNNLDLVGLDLNTVKNFFVNNLKNSSAKYLKTPSVIVTFNDMRTTGGHNLSSKINRVNSMQNYKRDNSERKEVSGEQKPATPSSQPQASKPKVSTSTNTTSPPKPPIPQNIRPRTEVVPAGVRTQRGL
jgi:hypothetical protein